METSGSRPFLCKLCGKKVHSMSVLQQHTRIHRSVSPYQCIICSRSFRLQEQLKSHQLLHDQEKPLTCSWCDESFLEQYQLGQHLFRKHKIVANSIKTGLSGFDEAAKGLSPELEETRKVPTSISDTGRSAMVEVDPNLNIEIESPAVNGFGDGDRVDADRTESRESSSVIKITQETEQIELSNRTDEVKLIEEPSLNGTSQQNCQIESRESNVVSSVSQDTEPVNVIHDETGEIKQSENPHGTRTCQDTDEIKLIERTDSNGIHSETDDIQEIGSFVGGQEIRNIEPREHYPVSQIPLDTDEIELIESPTLTGVCQVTELKGTPIVNGIGPETYEIQVIETPAVPVIEQGPDPDVNFDSQQAYHIPEVSLVSVDMNGNAMGEEEEDKTYPDGQIQKCSVLLDNVPTCQTNSGDMLPEENQVNGEKDPSVYVQPQFGEGETNGVVMNEEQSENMEVTYSEDAEMNEAIMLLTELKDATITEPEEITDNDDDVQELFTNDDVQELPTNDDVQELPTNDDVQVLPTSDNVQVLPTSDDVQELPTSEDVQELPTSNGVHVLPINDDVHELPTNNNVGEVTAVEEPIVDENQVNLEMAMMTDEESQNPTTGAGAPDNPLYMLRGDPSLHQCPSREDLCFFEESSALLDEEKVKTPSELSTMAPSWSNSCTNLSGLVMTTPHKLSVDPGAASLNASPAASPFRATLGRGDSDNEEDSTDIKAEKCQIEEGTEVKKENEGTADKESSISPGHTEASNDLPIQTTAITFTKGDRSVFQDFKNFTSGDSATVIGELRLVSESVPATCTNAFQITFAMEDEPLQSDDTTDSEKPARRRSARARRSIQWSDKMKIKKPKEWSALDESRRATVVLERLQDSQILRLKAGYGYRPARKRKRRIDDDYDYSQQSRQKRGTPQEPKRKRRRKSHNTSQDSLGKSDYEWSPDSSDTVDDEDAAEVESHCSSNKSGSGDATKDPETGLDYNLRPKRRKSFQVLLDGCECVLENDEKDKKSEKDEKNEKREKNEKKEKVPNHRGVHIKRYQLSMGRVHALRTLVTRMIKTVFPDITYPALFHEDGLCVEYLMDEIMDACGEPRRKAPLSAPFGAVTDKVKVVVCRSPMGCLRYLQRKTVRLLKTLLPDIKSETIDPARMNALLEEVIQTNLTAAATSVEQSSEQQEPT